MADSDLQKRLEHLGRRLVEDIERWEQSTRDTRRDALSSLTEHLGQKISEAVAKERDQRLSREQKRLAKKGRQKEERRALKRQRASVALGLFQLLAAVGFVVFAVLRPELWWMVFVALGLGFGGAHELALVGERRRLEAGEQKGRAPLTRDAQAHEVDQLCDQLLAELKEAPEAVRQFVQAPEKTIATLRSTARALDERRRQLLSEVPPERFAALDRQERDLVARRDAATDAHTRERLGEALHSLAGQRGALAQLKTAAERVDGEYTSLLVSLQELRTRVAVARSAGSDAQLEGLDRTVNRLNTELEAIGEALSAVAHDTVQPVSPIAVAPVASASPERVRR